MAKVDKYCTIFVVRHGVTDWNAKKIFQGNNDIALNERGKKQSVQLAKKLQPVKFDAVYSSDLLRAKQTAAIIALERQLAVTTTKALREGTRGEFDGKSDTEYQDKLKSLLEKFSRLSDQEKFKFQFPFGIESYGSVIARLITFLREISVAHLGETILVVSHGGVMMHLLVHLGYCTYQQLPSGYFIDNLAFIKVTCDGKDFFVKETSGINLQNV